MSSAECHDVAPMALPHPALLPDDLDEVRAALSALATGRTTPVPPPRDTPELSPGDAEFDDFFRLRRVNGPAAAALAAALGRATLLLTAPPADDRDLAVETTDLRAGLRMLHRGPCAPTTLPAARRWPAAVRWRAGHQVFVVFIQVVIVGLRHARGRLATGDVAAVIAGLDVAAAFLRSSAAAMRFTGGFDPAEYPARIRPLMAPPAVSDRFSGLMSVDHRALVAELAAWGRAERPGGVGPAHRRLRAAVDHAYREHIHVCARFVGADAPSLLTPDTAEPAVTVLHRLRRHRLDRL